MPQDLQIDAPPALPTPQNFMTFQSKFPAVTLIAGVPMNEALAAVDPAGPFHFQLNPNPKPLFAWNSGALIPEGNMIPALYPEVVFTKLVDDPSHRLDPQSLVAQGGAKAPIVLILGITLGVSDSLLGMIAMPPDPTPDANTATNHVTALVRPVALCLDPRNPLGGATLVTPYLTGPSADPTEPVPPGGKPLFDPMAVGAALSAEFGAITFAQGCLPPGRYAINAVYPTGQAWTTPNETGSCAATEGPMSTSGSPLFGCTAKPRPVLYSQGTRAVLEVTSSPGSAQCAMFPVPQACRPLP